MEIYDNFSIQKRQSWKQINKIGYNRFFNLTSLVSSENRQYILPEATETWSLKINSISKYFVVLIVYCVKIKPHLPGPDTRSLPLSCGDCIMYLFVLAFKAFTFIHYNKLVVQRKEMISV